MSILRILILIGTACTYFSCKEQDSGSVPTVLPDRTVIAYLSGDNSLSDEVDSKIDALYKGMQGMEATASHLIVYADYRNAIPKLFSITKEGVETIKTYSNRNSADATVLKATLSEIVRMYPAKSYGLICFSHASGWLPQGALEDPVSFPYIITAKSVLNDGGTDLSIADFARSLPILPNNMKFEFIVFEACFMAGVEVAYELKDKTKYIIGSAAEMLSDGLVQIYSGYLSLLFETTPKLKEFSERYYDLWNSKSGAYRSATITLIDTSALVELKEIVKSILTNKTNELSSLSIGTLQHFDRNAYHLFFDLSDVIDRMTTTEQKAAYTVALSKVVKYQAATPAFMIGYPNSFVISKHSGLTIYLEQASFDRLTMNYKELDWNI